MEPNNPDPQSGLQVDHESRSSFKDAAKWSNFISVIYLICFGILALVLLLAGPFMFSNTAEYDGVKIEQQGSPVMRILQLTLMVIFLIYAGMMLLRFASACRRGVEMQDQQSFNFGLKALRNYFIAVGCYTIIRIVVDIFSLTNTF